MLRFLLPVVLAASVAHPFIKCLYEEPIHNWLAPHPTMLSLGQVVVARLVCDALSLLTVSILILVVLIALKIPRSFLIVLCSTLALFSTGDASFTGLVCYSRIGFFLLNAAFYLSVYGFFYWLFVRENLHLIGKIAGGLAVAVLMCVSFSMISHSLYSSLYRKAQLSIVRNFDFTVYAPVGQDRKVNLKYFVARNDAGSPPHLQLLLSQEIDLYETRLPVAFNPPDNCGSVTPGFSLPTTDPCERAFVTPKGREVYMRKLSGIYPGYYFRMNDTLITFQQRMFNPPASDLKEFVDSFEPTNAEGIQALLNASK